MADAGYRVTITRNGVPVFIGSVTRPDDLVRLFIEDGERRIEVKATEVAASAADPFLNFKGKTR